MKRGIIRDFSLIAVVMTLTILGFQNTTVFKTIETQELIIRGENASTYIKLDGKQKYPSISIMNKAGISLAVLSLEDPKTPIFSLNDSSGKNRFSIKGGQVPGLFLKNDANRTIGSWSLLKDGSAGFGLAYESGIASTIIRGGNNSSISFFGDGISPIASFGVTKTVPHIQILGKSAKEGLLLHGGENPGMMVLDDLGQLRVYISKQGIMHSKEQPPEKPKEKEKLFTFEEDYSRLFPDVLKQEDLR